MTNVHNLGERWESSFASPFSNKGIEDERVGALLQDILANRPEDSRHKVIVFPKGGKAECMELTELKTMWLFLRKSTCSLLQSSEGAIKTYLERNKSSLKEKGKWISYLKSLESFAHQKGGILDTYFCKEEIKTIIEVEVNDQQKEYLCALMKKAFASAKSLDDSDLWILDQIPRLGLLVGDQLPIGLDKIQSAVHNLALKPDDVYPSFFKDLKMWLIDSTAEGDKIEAANRIIEAWLHNSTELNLYDLGLNKIPPQIGQLVNLRVLNLSNNNLESLPPQIGQLVKLEWLSLEHNNLGSLPPQIGQLLNLQWFFLHNNNLESLPPQIGQLVRLEKLYLYNNNLSDLPMSLGNLPGLTYLDISGTQIPQSTADAILQQCRMMRYREALGVLPHRLEKWKRVAGRSVDLSGIEDFNDQHKMILNEWLFRLEKTSDFASAQSALAGIVCEMLQDVIKNKEFRELFFEQAEANNKACGDRAAMSLNEIYTSWRILTLPGNAPLNEKLDLMTRAAKTLCLRSKIAGLISAEERAKFNAQISLLNGTEITKERRKEIEEQCAELESVEIFLNYETALKKKLNLLSAIKDMLHRGIGDRSWINQGNLEKEVNRDFFNDLYNLPIFQKVLPENLKQQMEAIDETYQEKLIALGICPKGKDTDKKVLDFKHEQGKIMQQRHQEKIAIARTWYEGRWEKP